MMDPNTYRKNKEQLLQVLREAAPRQAKTASAEIEALETKLLYGNGVKGRRPMYVVLLGRFAAIIAQACDARIQGTR